LDFFFLFLSENWNETAGALALAVFLALDDAGSSAVRKAAC